jgi:hypothetical protein
MEDSDTLMSCTPVHLATVPGQASPNQDSDRGQAKPSRSNSGDSVGYTGLLPSDGEESTDCASSSQDQAQTPTVRPTGRRSPQMESPTDREQPYDRGSRVQPSTRSDTFKNTILFANRFAAAILHNSWGSGAFKIATRIMEIIDVRRSLTAFLLVCTTDWFFFPQSARLNEDLNNDLISKFKAFLYLLGKMQDKDKVVPPSESVLEAFEEWVSSLFKQLLLTVSQEPG